MGQRIIFRTRYWNAQLPNASKRTLPALSPTTFNNAGNTRTVHLSVSFFHEGKKKNYDLDPRMGYCPIIRDIFFPTSHYQASRDLVDTRDDKTGVNSFCLV